MMGKRELVALLSLSFWCLIMVVSLFLVVPLICLQFVLVVFPDHTHLLFLNKTYYWFTPGRPVPTQLFIVDLDVKNQIKKNERYKSLPIIHQWIHARLYAGYSKNCLYEQHSHT